MSRLSRTPSILSALLAWTLLAWGGSAVAASVLAVIPEFVSLEGGAYAGVLHLDGVVEDSQADDADLLWHVTESAHLDIEITKDRHLVARVLDDDWTGVEHVLLSVCNPLGTCAAQTVSFRVEAVPDDPTIGWLPEQVVGDSATFPPLDLRPYGWDVDGDTALEWSASNGTALTASVSSGILTVTPRDSAWRGTEGIQLSLADSTGRMTTRTLLYTVTDGTPVTLTFVGNRLFQIQCGETRVVIDGLLRDAIALSESEKARLALALPPFDAIDLALATHEHYDHMTPGIVVDYLLHSASTLFVSVTEAVDLLRDVEGYAAVADRVLGIPYQDGDTADLDMGPIHVTAYGVRHQGDGSNLAYLIAIGGAKILILGDAGFEIALEDLVSAYAWPSLDIDVALVSPPWLEVRDGELVTRGIAPRYVISGPLRECPLRLRAAAGDPVPEVICGALQTWIVPVVAMPAGE